MEQAQEKVFFQDTNVTVTQARFVARGKTYAMRNISSVSNFRIEKSRTFPIAMIVLGILMLFPEGVRPAGAFVAIAGIIWVIMVKDDYSVRINSNSGEADGFLSKDRDYVQKIVDAVNDAIVHRG